MMRKEILKAAVRCDYELLEALTLRGDGTFQYSFGQDGPDGSALYWAEAEAKGEGVLALMVKILTLPHATRAVTVDEGPGTGSAGADFTWPSADKEQRSNADWQALEAIYSKEEISQWRKADLYTGYRLGITSGGDWTHFVAGD